MIRRPLPSLKDGETNRVPMKRKPVSNPYTENHQGLKILNATIPHVVFHSGVLIQEFTSN